MKTVVFVLLGVWVTGWLIVVLWGQEVSLAYEQVKEVDALDISEEGQEAWNAAIRRYEERIERVEARMTPRNVLLDELVGAVEELDDELI